MDSLVSTVTGVRAGRSGVPVPIGARKLYKTYRPALGPTRRPEYRGSSPEIKRQGVKLTTHLHLVLRFTSTLYIHGAGIESFYQI